jgi:hypothetical protein
VKHLKQKVLKKNEGVFLLLNKKAIDTCCHENSILIHVKNHHVGNSKGNKPADIVVTLYLQLLFFLNS